MQPADKDFWKRLIQNLTRARKKRNVLLVLALSLGFLAFLLLVSTSVAWLDDAPSQWLLLIAGVVCGCVALLFRVLAERF